MKRCSASLIIRELEIKTEKEKQWIWTGGVENSQERLLW